MQEEREERVGARAKESRADEVEAELSVPVIHGTVCTRSCHGAVPLSLWSRLPSSRAARQFRQAATGTSHSPEPRADKSMTEALSSQKSSIRVRSRRISRGIAAMGSRHIVEPCASSNTPSPVRGCMAPRAMKLVSLAVDPMPHEQWLMHWRRRPPGSSSRIFTDGRDSVAGSGVSQCLTLAAPPQTGSAGRAS